MQFQAASFAGPAPEAAVDLARLAGLPPGGAICELVNDDGTMMRAPGCREFADEHGLSMISIADLIAFIRHKGKFRRAGREANLPTEHGDFTAIGYRDTMEGSNIWLWCLGTSAMVRTCLFGSTPECLTGDVMGRCAAIVVRS